MCFVLLDECLLAAGNKNILLKRFSFPEHEDTNCTKQLSLQQAQQTFITFATLWLPAALTLFV